MCRLVVYGHVGWWQGWVVLWVGGCMKMERGLDRRGDITKCVEEWMGPRVQEVII